MTGKEIKEKVCSDEEVQRAIDIIIKQHLEAFKELAKV